MAKKVVVTDNAENVKPRKKRSWCCSCLIAVAVVCVVFTVALCGVGWYFGDIYSRRYFDMSLTDTFGVLNGLYWSNDKKVVKYGFEESDRNDLYDQIKSNLLLKTDTVIDFDDALSGAIDSLIAGVDKGGDAMRRNEAGFSEGDGGDGGEGGEEGGANSEIMNVLVGMIADVFTRDNIDVEKLSAYTEENDDYVFELKDKSLAAFVDFVLDRFLETGVSSFIPAQVSDMVSLKDVFALKQIKFDAQSTQNELGENVVSATSADITVWLGLQDAAGSAIKAGLKSVGYEWAGGFLAFCGNVILPKNVYVTVTLPLDGDAQAQVNLNGMSEKKRDNMYKLINGVLGLTGSEDTVETYLTMFGDMIKPYIEAAADSIDFTSAATGTIELDLLGTLTNFASDSLSPDDPITKPEFMYMLKALFTSSAEGRLEQLKPYLYTDWYTDGNGNYYHKPTSTEGLTPVDYEREFVKEIENKYSVDFGEDAKLDDVLAMLGISLDGENGSAGSPDIMNMINAERFQASLDKSIDELRLRVTDRMLASALSSQLDKMLTGEGGGFGGLELGLDALTFVEKEVNGVPHTLARLAVDVGTGKLLDSLGDNMLGALAVNVLPEKILLSVDIDVTLDRPEGFAYAPSKFMFNDYADTASVLATLKKIVPSLDLASMTEQIEQMLRSMLDDLDGKLGITLVPSVQHGDDTTSGALEMPDVFTVITETVLTKENAETGEKEPIVSADGLKEVLRQLNNTDGFDGECKVNASDESLVRKITDLYYLNPPADSPLASFSDITAYMQGDVNGHKFRLTDDGNSLVYDDRTAAELTPVITGAELGSIISSNMGNSLVSSGFTLLDVEVFADKLELLLSVDTEKLLPSNVKSIINSNALFVTATVDLNESNVVDGAYPVTLKVNNMTANETDVNYVNLMKIVRFFNADFDIESQTSELGAIMYTQMNDLESSLGLDIRFTDGGVELPSFYSFLAQKMNLQNDDPETVKAAVQGMYVYDADKSGANAYNYVVDDFMFNEGDKTGGGTFESGTYTDKQFNGYFVNIANRIVDDGSLVAHQTIVLSAGDNRTDAGHNAKAVRDWVNERLAADNRLDAANDYLVVTFEMKMDDFMSGSENSVGFLPDKIYVTAVIEWNGSAFAQKGIIFNAMNAQTYDVLLELMHLEPDASNPDKVNIDTIVGSSINALNLLKTAKNISFGTCAGDGIGNVTVADRI